MNELRPPLHDLSWVGRRIWRRVLGGAVAVAVALVLTYGSCTLHWWRWGWQAAFCKTLWAEPPWALFYGLAAAPALMLLWQWKTAQRGQELELARQQQVANRFLDGIKLLDDAGKDTSTILGAIFALEQVAHDSAEYRVTVGQVLAALVRRKSPRDRSAEPLEHYPADQMPHRNPDVILQALMVVLGRIRSSTELDLRDVDLSQMDLRGANFERVNFARSNLAGAWLDGSNLKCAVFNNADLWRADLTNTDMRGARLAAARMQATNLAGANLSKAELSGADLRGAELSSAKLDDAVLVGAKYDVRTGLPGGVRPERMNMVRDGTED